MKTFIIVALATIAIGSLIGNAMLYSRYSSNRAVVQIGKEKVTVKEYRDALEYSAGKSILTKLVYTKMVRQAASDAGIAPSEKDVDARIKEIERTQPAMLEDANRDPGKMELLRRDIGTDLALDNLRIKDIKVTDSEVADFYNKNKKLFTLPKQANSLLIVTANKNDANTAETLLKQNIKPEVIAQQPGLHVVGIKGYSPDWRRLPSADNQRLSNAVFSLKPGQITVIPLSNNQGFVTVRLASATEEKTPAMSEIKDKVARTLKLSKAIPPAVELKKIFDASNMTFELDKYSGYFEDIRNLKVPAAATPAAKPK